MRNSLQLFGSILVGLLLVETALADSSMRCGRNIVSRGDNPGEVLAHCGEPIFATEKKIYRSGIPNRRFRTLSLGNGYYSDITSSELIQHNRSVVEVPVEIWTYNFGPRYFMREVTFLDSKVTSIKTLGYGH